MSGPGGPRSNLRPAPVGIDQALPARAVEPLPLALGLGQAIGDGVDGGRMVAEAAMAAIDLDVLDLPVLVVDAGLPGADAVRAAEDRGGRHGRRLRQGTRHMMVAVV